jgi:hypothetical protein
MIAYEMVFNFKQSNGFASNNTASNVFQEMGVEMCFYDCMRIFLLKRPDV